VWHVFHDRLVRAFPWHVRIFLAVNVILGIANAATGGPWWAFWPLLITAVALGVHYLFRKAAAADERWAEQRAEELNLKSYDRSQIENLKARYHDGTPPDQRR
jgi:hypothetical protein